MKKIVFHCSDYLLVLRLQKRTNYRNKKYRVLVFHGQIAAAGIRRMPLLQLLLKNIGRKDYREYRYW